MEFLEILEPNEEIGWHASVFPEDHPISQFEFDFIVGKLYHVWSHIAWGLNLHQACMYIYYMYMYMFVHIIMDEALLIHSSGSH